MYKKILIIIAGRINHSDTANNGLLFRNLFKHWPKDKIAQIFNSGNNGDTGFFSSYYQLGEKDRNFGKLYKKIYKSNISTLNNSASEQTQSINSCNKAIPFLKKTLIETGLYELIFRPRLSQNLKTWLDHYKPELILVQGYSITFCELSVLIKKYTKAKLAFFTTDDWPTYLYSGMLGESKILAYLPRQKVKKTIKNLLQEVDIPIAFGFPMQEEYTKRYGKHFYSVIHADDPSRFENLEPIRLTDAEIFSIVTIGTFNRFRWPLLKDFELVCRGLEDEGIKVKITILSDAVEQEGKEEISKMKYIQLHPDPGSDKLPGYLKGADLLLLIEGFEEEFVKAIELSISTKAHLYMFSKVPIMIYAHNNTGIANYAKHHNWAKVVSDRNRNTLRKELKSLLTNNDDRELIIQKSYSLAVENHNSGIMENVFLSILNSDLI